MIGITVTYPLDLAREMHSLYDADGRRLGVFASLPEVDRYICGRPEQRFYVAIRSASAGPPGTHHYHLDRYEALAGPNGRAALFPVDRIPARRGRSVDLDAEATVDLAPEHEGRDRVAACGSWALTAVLAGIAVGLAIFAWK